MWGGEGMLAVAGGAWLAQIAPPYAPTLEIVGRSVIGGLGGLIVAIFIIFVWNFIRAPYKQRNEAWNALSKKPKPMSNKDALLRAISTFAECALMEFTQQEVRNEHSCKVCPLMEPSDFVQAYKVLSAEKLVAGEKADNIVSRLMHFVLTQMIAQLGDKSSSVEALSTDEFIDKLRKMTKRTIKGIENL